MDENIKIKNNTKKFSVSKFCLLCFYKKKNK